MTPERFHDILLELLDENPFAVRSVLKLLRTEYTDAVPTLAITCEAQPSLLVNLDFISRTCTSDAHVKAVICHEFLHLLLRHTEKRSPVTFAEHIAMDAVINAIIHRQHGEAYSGMMAAYYKDAKGVKRLLRPPAQGDREALLGKKGRSMPGARTLWSAWQGLYEGKLVVDDIAELVKTFEKSDPALRKAGASGRVLKGGTLLGNHGGKTAEVPEELAEALRKTMRAMNGQGIWRSPRGDGTHTEFYDAVVNAAPDGVEIWKRTTLAVLRRHLTPDKRARKVLCEPAGYSIPVLGPGDRRAFLRSLWSPFLPEAAWVTHPPRSSANANLYLDVSGSMGAEMPLIIQLLGGLRRYIRMPFWAFSDKVAPAVIEAGQLRTSTSGGTSMNSVLRHLAETRPECAVVVTDGYIEAVDAGLLKTIAAVRLHALVTRDGSAAQLERAGIPYTQLEAVRK